MKSQSSSSIREQSTAYQSVSRTLVVPATSFLQRIVETLFVAEHDGSLADKDHTLLPPPSVVVVDALKSLEVGLEDLRSVRRIYGEKPKYLIVGRSLTSHEIILFIREGMDGFLSWVDLTLSALIRTINALASGQVVFPRSYTSALAAYVREKESDQCTSSTADSAELTAREKEVLHQLSLGARSREVAESLSISLPTVHKHVQNIFSKLQVHTRIAAISKLAGANELGPARTQSAISTARAGAPSAPASIRGRQQSR